VLNFLIMLSGAFSYCYAECYCSECHNAQCHYGEIHGIWAGTRVVGMAWAKLRT
jgi:hypothetical protein